MTGAPELSAIELGPAVTSAKQPIVLSWSGGKDSMMAAHQLLASQKFEITSLLTAVTADFDRISVHGVRRQLLELQADALGLDLHVVPIPKECSNELYEERMQEAFESFKLRGITQIAFGDLFLEDVKLYREQLLSRCGMRGVYPIWMRDTAELVRTFIGLGFKAKLSCVDTHALDPSFAGREIDLQFLEDLPRSVDPCGENGEFHSFVYEGPLFRKPIACRSGEMSLQLSRFNYCDIVLA